MVGLQKYYEDVIGVQLGLPCLAQLTRVLDPCPIILSIYVPVPAFQQRWSTYGKDSVLASPGGVLVTCIGLSLASALGTRSPITSA